MDLNEIYIPEDHEDLKEEEKIVALVDFYSDVIDYEEKEISISVPKTKEQTPTKQIENVELSRKNSGLF